MTEKEKIQAPGSNGDNPHCLRHALAIIYSQNTIVQVTIKVSNSNSSLSVEILS